MTLWLLVLAVPASLVIYGVYNLGRHHAYRDIRDRVGERKGLQEGGDPRYRGDWKYRLLTGDERARYTTLNTLWQDALHLESGARYRGKPLLIAGGLALSCALALAAVAGLPL